MCLLTLVYVRPPVSSADLDVAEAGNQQDQVCALAVGEAGGELQRLACFKDLIDRDGTGYHGVPRSVRLEGRHSWGRDINRPKSND